MVIVSMLLAGAAYRFAHAVLTSPPTILVSTNPPQPQAPAANAGNTKKAAHAEAPDKATQQQVVVDASSVYGWHIATFGIALVLAPAFLIGRLVTSVFRMGNQDTSADPNHGAVGLADLPLGQAVKDFIELIKHKV